MHKRMCTLFILQGSCRNPRHNLTPSTRHFYQPPDRPADRRVMKCAIFIDRPTVFSGPWQWGSRYTPKVCGRYTTVDVLGHSVHNP